MTNFNLIYNKNPKLIVSASGRVNLIGEHIDYCGGKVLPISLNLACKVYSAKNDTNLVNLSFKGIKEIVSLDLNNLENYKKLKLGSYQAGVLDILKKMGYNLIGLDMYFDCDIPFGAGLSSSAGIEVSTMITMLEHCNKEYSLKDVAIWCQRAENEYCGVNCGIMDQFASCNGKKNGAMLLDCKNVECSYIPCDFENYSLLVCNCNKPRSLIKSEYNNRRQETEIALKLLKEVNNIQCLADLSVEAFEKTKYVLSGKILDRATHIVYECDRVDKAVKCLINGNLIEFGKLLNESHFSLRDRYETTGIELDTLSDLMRNFDGCIGARMTGAGFGGCCICLVDKQRVDDLKKHCVAQYKNKIGYEPTFYDITIEDGVKINRY